MNEGCKTRLKLSSLGKQLDQFTYLLNILYFTRLYALRNVTSYFWSEHCITIMAISSPRREKENNLYLLIWPLLRDLSFFISMFYFALQNFNFYCYEVLLVLCKLISCEATWPTSHFSSEMRFSFLSIQTELLNLFDGYFSFKENKHKAVANQKCIWSAFPHGTRIYQSRVDISRVIPSLPHPHSSVPSIWSRDFSFVNDIQDEDMHEMSFLGFPVSSLESGPWMD